MDLPTMSCVAQLASRQARFFCLWTVVQLNNTKQASSNWQISQTLRSMHTQIEKPTLQLQVHSALLPGPWAAVVTDTAVIKLHRLLFLVYVWFLTVSDCFGLFPFGEQKENKRRLEQYVQFACA